MPHQSYQSEQDPILIQEENGSVKRLDDHSFIMRALSDQWENTSLVCIDQEVLGWPLVKKLCKKLRGL